MSTPPDPGRPPDATPPWEQPESPWQRPPAGAPQDGPPGLGGPPGYGAPPPYDPPPRAAQPGHGAPPPYSPLPQPSRPGYPPPGYGPPRYGPGHAPPGYGPPQHPQPPYGPPPHPQSKSNRRVLALIGALAVVAIVLVGGLAFVVFRGNPRDTADAFMSALRAKDVDKAHSMLCKDGQQRQSKEELRRGFDLDERTITGYRLGTERERQREGKDETLIPVTITYDQGTEVRIDLGVWNEGGQKICSFNPPGG